MGTRQLVCVILDNEFKVGQYGQWDGCPSAAGINVLTFLRKMDLLSKISFTDKVAALEAVTSEEMAAFWTELGANPDVDFVSMDISEAFFKKYPHLHRDCGAKILDYVASGEVTKVLLSQSFAGNGLFCEWAYVINLDTNLLEVYQGFGKNPVPENNPLSEFLDKESKYSPIRLTNTFSLFSLPTDDVFLDQCDPAEEEVA